MSGQLFKDDEPPRFKTILADPPWLERGGGKCKRGADRHYPLMKRGDIFVAMLGDPLWRPAASCHLYLWVTNNFLVDGLWLMGRLGFRYVTNVCWHKMRNGKSQIGLGQYFRGSHELMLFGVKGDFMKPAKARPSVIIAERTKHSQKPEASYELIEASSPSPRIEFFARSLRDGWESMGNEL